MGCTLPYDHAFSQRTSCSPLTLADCFIDFVTRGQHPISQTILLKFCKYHGQFHYASSDHISYVQSHALCSI